MAKRILITGGSGLVGNRLTEMLTSANHEVAWLSRTPDKYTDIKTFYWNIKEDVVEEAALQWCDVIVHLAGAGVADERWTEKRKSEIFNSRIDSTQLLSAHIEKLNSKPEAFISASAIGYYGMDTGDRWMEEADPPKSDDFLANVVKAWEAEVDNVAKLDIRTVKIRIGVVLSKSGGALSRMLPVFKLGIGAPLGDGKQFMSWIHLEDLCRMFYEAIEHDSWSGVYNGVGPEPVTNAEFSRQIARALHKPFFMPNVPSFALKFIMGEMANIILGGNRVSCSKVLDNGFVFKFKHLEEAFSDLL